jgi:putative heme iron utilization protein
MSWTASPGADGLRRHDITEAADMILETHCARTFRAPMRFAIAILASFAFGPVIAASFCATPAQLQQVREFYASNPGTMPAIAARRLNLPEATVASALPAAESASLPGSHFATVWAAMTQWQEATFLIMKGANVFEIRSGVGKAERSKTSAYTNIEYVHPLRGHLRPDLYQSIYAVALPGRNGAVARGIIFYDGEGASVFGAFVSGDEPAPPSEIAKFDRVMKLVRAGPVVCPSAPAAPVG